MKAVTCISGGPFTFAATGAGFLVRPVSIEERSSAKVAAFIADEDCSQMVLAWPTYGLTRDYRKATVDQVCAALEKEGKPFVRSGKAAGFTPQNTAPASQHEQLAATQQRVISAARTLSHYMADERMQGGYRFKQTGHAQELESALRALDALLPEVGQTEETGGL
jgi:hypothetical protein